jgi:hypothetical protein|tara:strand:- start:100 stop:429 length:330 start_codon:yes stop_codon:yes gene_type:complete
MLSKSDKQYIKIAIKDAILSAISLPTDTNNTVETTSISGSNVQEITKDPSVQAAHDTEAELLRQMANPRMVLVRGKKTTQLVNQTKDSLDSIRAYMNDRNQFGTSKIIR